MTTASGPLAPIPANRAQWISAVCSIVTALTAMRGVYSFHASTRRERVKAAQDAIAKIYPFDIELERLLTDHADLRAVRRYDPDGRRWKAMSNEVDREKFRSTCSMMGNVFEYYLLIRANIENHPNGRDIISGWDGYVEDVCKKSYAFRGHIRSKPSVWAPMFLEIFNRHTKGLPAAEDMHADHARK